MYVFIGKCTNFRKKNTHFLYIVIVVFNIKSSIFYQCCIRQNTSLIMYNVCNMYNITETIDCFLYKSYVFQKDCERWSCFVRLVYDFTTKREKNVWKELTEHCYHIIEHCYIYFFQTIKKLTYRFIVLQLKYLFQSLANAKINQFQVICYNIAIINLSKERSQFKSGLIKAVEDCHSKKI